MSLATATRKPGLLTCGPWRSIPPMSAPAITWCGCICARRTSPPPWKCSPRHWPLDKTGEFRDRLLQKLNEILPQLALRHQQEYLLLINLVSKYARPEDQDKPKPDRAV